MTVGLNKEDAASLLIRLLSESGISGTMAFMRGMDFRHGACASLYPSEYHPETGPNALLSLAIGVTASMIGIGIACMARAPQYYAPWFWLPMALTASVPALLARVAIEARGDRICTRLSAKPVVLTTVPYYLPGFKGGGKLVTVRNLIAALRDQFHFKV